MLKIFSHCRSQKGFTLIELLVVIAIIGLLATIVLVSLNTARAKARDTRRKSDIRQIMLALEMYYSDKGEYPASGGASSPNGSWSNSNDSSWDTLQNKLDGYITLPEDPRNETGSWPGDGEYSYAFFSLNYGCSQQWYMLVYKLENPDITSPGVKTCDGTSFNYGGTITIGVSGIQ
jgi:type II secretion system protein G